MGCHGGRANAHGAELGHFEGDAVSTDAIGPVQGGTFGSQADNAGNQRSRHCYEDGNCATQQNIKEPVHSLKLNADRHNTLREIRLTHQL